MMPSLRILMTLQAPYFSLNKASGKNKHSVKNTALAGTL